MFPLLQNNEWEIKKIKSIIIIIRRLCLINLICEMKMEIIRHAPNSKSLVWIRYLFNLNKLTGTQTGGNIKIIEHLKKKKKKTLNSVSLTIGKDSDAGRDWRQEEKGMTEDEMAGWHHWLNGRESEWTPGVGDGQGGLVCCDSWGRKESDTTEQLNWTEVARCNKIYNLLFSLGPASPIIWKILYNLWTCF